MVVTLDTLHSTMTKLGNQFKGFEVKLDGILKDISILTGKTDNLEERVGTLEETRVSRTRVANVEDKIKSCAKRVEQIEQSYVTGPLRETGLPSSIDDIVEGINKTQTDTNSRISEIERKLSEIVQSRSPPSGLLTTQDDQPSPRIQQNQNSLLARINFLEEKINRQSQYGARRKMDEGWGEELPNGGNQYPRHLNLLIHGLEYERNENLRLKVAQFFDTILQVTGMSVKSCRRVTPKPNSDRVGIVIVNLPSRNSVIMALKNGFNLKHTPYAIDEDLTPEARKVKSIIIKQAKTHRDAGIRVKIVRNRYLVVNSDQDQPTFFESDGVNIVGIPEIPKLR